MRALCLLPLLLLGACQKDFDSQYAETEKRVKAAEAKIDAAREKQAKQEVGEQR